MVENFTMQYLWKQFELHEIGQFIIIPVGTLLYHERETRFPYGNQPCFSYNWFSFEPNFFTNGDPPTYPCASYTYEVVNDIICFSLNKPLDALNSYFKNWCRTIRHVYRTRYSHDDYAIASLCCEGLLINGILMKEDNMVILNHSVSENFKFQSLTCHYSNEVLQEKFHERDNESSIHFTFIPEISFATIYVISSSSSSSSYDAQNIKHKKLSS